MKDKIQKIKSDLELLKQEFKKIISDKSKPLKERVLLFEEAPNYMKETMEDLFKFEEKCPLNKEYLKNCPVEKNEVFDIGYELSDEILFIIDEIEKDGKDYSHITREEFETIFIDENNDEENSSTYDSFQRKILLIEELMKNNVGFVVIDW